MLNVYVEDGQYTLETSK